MYDWMMPWMMPGAAPPDAARMLAVVLLSVNMAARATEVVTNFAPLTTRHTTIGTGVGALLCNTTLFAFELCRFSPRQLSARDAAIDPARLPADPPDIPDRHCRRHGEQEADRGDSHQERPSHHRIRHVQDAISLPKSR